MAEIDFPVFDSDNHLYETRDALTRFLPEQYWGAIDFVEVHGRTKIVVRGHIGLAEPVSYIEELDGPPSGDVRKIMGANMMGLLGIGN